MNFSCRDLHWAIVAYLAMVSGSSGLASEVAAQAIAPAVCRPGAAGASADEDCRLSVQAALQAAPYFYDAHVTVAVKKGAIVLRGFVFSDWDLRDAIRIASAAAGTRRVVDELSIVAPGRR